MDGDVPAYLMNTKVVLADADPQVTTAVAVPGLVLVPVNQVHFTWPEVSNALGAETEGNTVVSSPEGSCETGNRPQAESVSWATASPIASKDLSTCLWNRASISSGLTDSVL